MSSRETDPSNTKEKLKRYFWKFIGFTALAVGALVVINHIASRI